MNSHISTSRKRFLFLAGLTSVSIAVLLSLAAEVRRQKSQPISDQSAGPASAPKPGRARSLDAASYGKLPLSFELNKGQTDPQVKFISRGPGYGLFLTADSAVLSLSKNGEASQSRRQGPTDSPPTRSGVAVSMRLKGASGNARISGVDELPGKVNYLLGNHRENWRTNVPTFAKVRYEDIYPKIDLVYYGNQRQLEYDFEIAPGADPKSIQLTFSGGSLKLDRSGVLKVITAGGEIAFLQPQAYQMVQGRRQEIASRYIKTGRNEIAFSVGKYEKSLPLVIDPVLAYSTYLGGSDSEFGFGIAVDSSGSAYVTGQTFSTDFPGTGAMQPHGDLDAFVTKLNPAGSAILYSTFLGGSGSDTAYGIAVNAAGAAFVTGWTNASDFPMVSPMDSTLAGTLDIFAAELNSAGSGLLYSTYLGGSGYDIGYSIALDQNGNVYVTGETGSQDFPVFNPIQANKAGNSFFKSSDGAGNWTTSDSGLAAVIVNGSAFDPANSSTLFAAADTGLFKSTNDGSTWTKFGSRPPPPPISKVAIDPTNAAVLYAATSAGVYKSTDGGDHFVASSTGLIPLSTRTVVISPLNPASLYACGVGSVVYRSTNGGNNWVGSNLNQASLVFDIAVDPSNAAVVYGGSNRGVYKSTDAGITWLAPNTTLRSSIRSLAVDRSNSLIVYAGSTAGIFKSSDAGINWLDITQSGTFGTVTAVAVDPLNSATVYYANSNIYKSTNGGASWSLSSTGYPGTIVNSLLINPTSTANLFAATHGGSDIFVAKISPGNPVPIYATYLGGSRTDVANGIAVDSTGNAYLAGHTTSLNLPTANAVQATSLSGDEAFVTKINSAGSALTYSSYLGGNGPDQAWGIGVDSLGNAYVVGETVSTNFPTLNPLPSGALPGLDAFVTKLSSFGSLVYSTHLGGSFNDRGFAIAVDSQGSAYVTGLTNSLDFPQVNQFANGNGAIEDAFVAKLHPTGTSLLYATYLGGSSFDQGLGIAVDASGSAYITGDTISTNFPTASPLQALPNGGEEVFISKIGAAVNQLRFANNSYNVSEGAGSILVTVTRVGDSSGVATVDFSTFDGSANQKKDYTIAAGTLSFASGETSKTFRVLVTDNANVDGTRVANLSLANSSGAEIGDPIVASLVIADNDAGTPTSNPLDDAQFFVRQHYYDFLSRLPDQGGLDYWSGQISECGSDQACLRTKRVDVSNAFFYELEYQQTGAYVYRLYRAAFGNNQPFPNPNANPQFPDEEKKLPSYAAFAPDRARVKGGALLAQTQLDLARAFIQRPAFLTKYPTTLNGAAFVDAVLTTVRNDVGADLRSQRQSLIDQFNQGGREAVIYRLADDNVQTNPIDNRSFIDAEYNRAFVATQYFGYLRRSPDIAGFSFWLGQVNGAPLRDVAKQHAMVCSFITSTEYQLRFSPVVTHGNTDCQ
jgi:hypothetical protein